jgi:uncharacterized membrane protein YgdD (TMEM256/DUF423 family)
MRIVHGLALMAAGLLGASGVAAAAASSHAGAALLGPYALIALTHAPALLALGLLIKTRLLGMSALALAAGALIFCADIAMRHFAGTGLFPYSAPFGGVLMMGGWLIIIAEGLLSTRR